ncbi:MAG: hypothetical protein HY906_12155 [Deltaproteobacteria bacterium]|nr:hypothetical protein [Deltaproteobacteria bacterium]
MEARRIDDGEFRDHLRAGQLQRAAAFAGLLQALDPGVPAAWRTRLLAATHAV